MLFQGKGASMGIVKVVLIHTKAAEEVPSRLIEEMGVPHDIHMAHLVKEFFGDNCLVCNWQGAQVHSPVSIPELCER